MTHVDGGIITSVCVKQEYVVGYHLHKLKREEGPIQSHMEHPN